MTIIDIFAIERNYESIKASKFAQIYNIIPFIFQDQTESAAILKIKESMQEEAKRFEKDSDHPDYFMQ